MAAPVATTTLRMLIRCSQKCTALNGNFVFNLHLLTGIDMKTHNKGALHLEDEKPQIRQIASRVTAQGTLEGSLQDGISQQGNPSAEAASTTTKTAAAESHRETTRSVPISPERAQQEMLLLRKPDLPPDARVLKVAIIGSPNAGKSTLINRLMGQRICSVSSKVHTTRSNALAVFTRNKTQIVLLDTPGMVSHLHGRRHNLARSLLVDPKNSLEEADLALVLVDASNKWTREKISNEILMSLHVHPNVSSILVLNKVDLVSSKQDLFKLTAELTEGIVGGHTFTLDDKSVRHLGKVEARPLMSHKYKPRLPKDGDSGSLVDESKRTESLDSDTDPVEKSSDDIEAVSPNERNDRSTEKFSETEEYDMEDRDHSIAESNSLTRTQDDPSVRNKSRLSPTLMDYVNNLEAFTPQSGNFEFTHPAVDPAEVDERRAEKERRQKLLREVGKRKGWDRFEAVFMVSALEGEGLEDVKEHLTSKARPGDWEYHRDVLTNLSPEEILTEAVREKLLEYLPQEVPYIITQSNDLWTMEENGRLRIVQKIVCYKKSHVKLLKRHIGQIAREAEENLMNAFKCQVHLTLRIKLR